MKEANGLPLSLSPTPPCRDGEGVHPAAISIGALCFCFKWEKMHPRKEVRALFLKS